MVREVHERALLVEPSVEVRREIEPRERKPFEQTGLGHGIGVEIPERGENQAIEQAQYSGRGHTQYIRSRDDGRMPVSRIPFDQAARSPPEQVYAIGMEATEDHDRNENDPREHLG